MAPPGRLPSCHGLLLLLAFIVLTPRLMLAQDDAFDPAWYEPDQRYVKIAVVADGVYRASGQDLASLGLSLSTIDPATFRLFENGREIPLHYTGDPAAPMGPGDALTFVGRRNRGTDEAWAYNFDASLQSSTAFSLYTDTTTYWLTWGGEAGRRYEVIPPGEEAAALPVAALRDTLHQEQDSQYYDGDSFDAGHPLYTRGEGYYWERFNHGLQTNIIERAYDANLISPLRSDTERLHVRVRVSSQTASRHLLWLSLRLKQGGSTSFVPVDTVDWRGYGFQTLEATVTQDQIPDNGNLRVRLTSSNEFGQGTPNGVWLDWIDVDYVRQLQTTDDRLHFTVTEEGTYSFTLTGFTSPAVLVYSPRDGRLLTPLTSEGALRVTDSPSGPAAYWAVQADNRLAPASMALDVSSNWVNPAEPADLVIVTTSSLRPSAEALASYRASEAGGGHTVAVVDVRDLFDQFDYGRPTPIALRRFVQATQNWSTPARFLLLWGDALYPDRMRPLRAWEVPAFGNAASDAWYALQTSGPGDWREVLAVGRIPVRDNDAGMLFVEKARQYEAAPVARWQKKGLFLVGGSTESQQANLQRYTLEWSDMAANPPTGLDTLHFFKNIDAPLDPTFKDSLRQALQQGTSWLSYFGHSAAQTWEIVTDPPEDYDNAGRLPVALSLGCYTGNFALGSGSAGDALSLAEQLVIGSYNGSIAHWGSSNLGAIGPSASLGEEVHRSVFQDTLRTLGLATQRAKVRYGAVHRDALAIKHLLQYGLIGDPATQLALPSYPDLQVTPALLTVSPLAPVPADSQLTVTVQIRNLGLVPADSFTVQLTHTGPDGSALRHMRRAAPFALQDTVRFFLHIEESFVGENRFTVEVDPENAYVEEDESNNLAERVQVVFSTGLAVIHPPDLGLLDVTDPMLTVAVAATEEVPIVFQLDTLPSFDTPALQEHRLMGRLAATWAPGTLEDGRSYYWRARVDDPEEPENWKEAAFTIRTDLRKRGWLQQGRLFQANEQSAFLERTESDWRFTSYNVEISLFSERVTASGTLGQMVVNGEIYERRGLGFGLIILDGGTGTIKGHGSFPTYPNPSENPAQMYADLKALAEQAASGDYFLIRTRNIGGSVGQPIPDSVKAIFRALGSAAIDTLSYRHLWAAIGRKDYPEQTQEWVEPPGNGVDILSRSGTLSFSFPEGMTVSPRFGPARTWESLGWTYQLDNASSDVRIDVLSADGSAVLLRAPTSSPTGEMDLSALSARDVPFLRLRATLSDSVRQSTPQLLQWHVGYRSVAELALDPAAFQLSADTLQEGQPLDLSVLVRNLSDVPADTAVLEYFLTDPSNETTLAHADTLLGLTEDATSTHTLSTNGLEGLLRLQVAVRQPGLQEQITFNNVLVRSLFINRDRTPPSFEVLVDGEPLPSDPNPVTNVQDPALPFVSARPPVEITIRDDNPYFSLGDDSTAVLLTLDGQRVPSSAVELVNRDDGENEIQLRYTPDLAGKDTTHTLVVTVQDASGNEAEGSPYQVHFRIQTDVQVESLYPYPNPMSTFTVFAFRLRGSDAALVDDFRIRIYTITGRLVREFNLVDDPTYLDAGTLRIGWNKLRWDCRDDDGDLIATGVYLYKVFLRTEGRETEVNNASGIEKLVILR